MSGEAFSPNNFSQSPRTAGPVGGDRAPQPLGTDWRRGPQRGSMDLNGWEDDMSPKDIGYGPYGPGALFPEMPRDPMMPPENY